MTDSAALLPSAIYESTAAGSEPVLHAEPKVNPTTRLESLVRETLARARPNVEAEGPPPAELAAREYHQLRLDNIALSDELRQCLVEREVAELSIQRLEAELKRLSDLADRRGAALAMLRGKMLTAGKLVLEIVNETDGMLDANPAVVQAFGRRSALHPTDGIGTLPPGFQQESPTNGE